MKIVCGSCGAKYSIADEKVQGKIFKIRCKKCDDVIVVKGTSDGEDLQAAESDFGGAYGHSDGASEWYVVLEGEQVGPITAEEVEAYFSVGQLSNESFVWRDGLDNWVPIHSISEFAHLVHMGRNDENTMIAATPGELGGFVPADDATAVIDSAKFKAGLYGMGGENPTYSAPDAGGQNYDSSGYGGYEGDAYGQSGSGAHHDGGYSGYESGPSGAGSYNDGYDHPASGYDDGYDADGGGGMFAAFDSAPAEESDYSGGFGGGYGGGSQGYESNDRSGGLSANAAVAANDMVGARNENSVLFSLSSLDQVQAVNKSAGGGQAAPAAGGNDKSGLIDIQALASAHASMKSGGAAGGGGFAGGADNFAPSTMSMPALMPMPMGSHRNNKGLMIAVIIGGSLVFVALIAVVAVLLMRDQPAPTVITEPAVAETAPLAPAANPEADAKVAAEAAEAARAALAAAEAPAPAPGASEEEEKPMEDPRQRGGSASKAVAKVEPKATARETVAAVEAPAKAAPKPAPKPAAKGGIDDILGQIDSKGSSNDSKSGGSAAASSAPAGNLPQKLTRPQVQTTVRQYNAQILRCQQSSNSNKLSGTVMVNFTIQPNGSISAANVQPGEFRGTDVGGCIENAVKGMKFPATQSDLTINYPFIIR